MADSGITDLRETIGHLERCIAALRTQYGDTITVRRLALDVERLDLDTTELEKAPRPTPHRRGNDVIYVPDSKFDEDAWLGAQDEGLGFHSRERTR
ncbi:hypothetical protein [Skermania piniformis]|uniref:Uncharacterized protein n=1 Tax=Skermania pinensis TaxID=39122 RepID=A0ABX8S781_9ACTN|nr:hypothetical protein [Skermania piniformis]QXQ13703.1 hypothetical protein KV203_18220 [Skermania piniformis]